MNKNHASESNPNFPQLPSKFLGADNNVAARNGARISRAIHDRDLAAHFCIRSRITTPAEAGFWWTVAIDKNCAVRIRPRKWLVF
jgi:hypothetical protein